MKNPFSLVLPVEGASEHPLNAVPTPFYNSLPFADCEIFYRRTGKFISQFYYGNDYQVNYFYFIIQKESAGYIKVNHPVVASAFVLEQDFRLMNLNLSDNVFIPGSHCIAAYFAKGVYPMQILPGSYQMLFVHPSDSEIKDLISKGAGFRRPALLREMERTQSEAIGRKKISPEMLDNIKKLSTLNLEEKDSDQKLREILFDLNQTLSFDELDPDAQKNAKEKAKAARAHILHYLTDPNLKDYHKISEELDIPVRVLNYEFKKLTGMPIFSFVQHERLELTKKYLTSTTLSLEEVAEKVGFPNRDYFYNLFLRTYRISPHKYRSNQEKKKLKLIKA